jgi:hypothetical protein
MSLLLRDTENYGNVYLDAGTIAEIGCAAYDADTVIDATKKALVADVATGLDLAP